MGRSKVHLTEALVAVALVVPGCSDTEDRAAPSEPSPSTVATSPTPTESASVTVSPTPSTAASPTPEASETWHRSFDFSIQAVAADDEGNAYLTGLSPTGPAHDWGPSMEMVLAKVDPAGEQGWVQRVAERLQAVPTGWDVSVSADGSRVYVAGEIMLPPWEAVRPRLWASRPRPVGCCTSPREAASRSGRAISGGCVLDAGRLPGGAVRRADIEVRRSSRPARGLTAIPRELTGDFLRLPRGSDPSRAVMRSLPLSRTGGR